MPDTNDEKKERFGKWFVAVLYIGIAVLGAMNGWHG